MSTVAIIQARMGSTRLPGKQVMDIAGKPLLWHVVTRAMRSRKLDGVIVAIPEERESEQIIQAIGDLGVSVCISKGKCNDLIHRYQTTASIYGIDNIVRIPGDNPCIDPAEIDRIIEFYEWLPKPMGQWLTTNLDQNVMENGYPGGLGAEVYDSWFLHWLDNNVDDEELREHPHKWAMRSGRVRTIPAPQAIKRPELRFDVNTLGDLEYVRDIYQGLYRRKPHFSATDIIEYLDKRELN